MFTFKRNHQFNHRWNLKTLRRIGEDLRKAGAITGVRICWIGLPNDNIGLVSLCYLHYLAYYRGVLACT